MSFWLFLFDFTEPVLTILLQRYDTGPDTASDACCICGGGTEVEYENNVVNGVMDLTLSIPANLNDVRDVEVEALEALETMFYVNRMDEKFDNVMLCIPFGTTQTINGTTTRDWLAYATRGYLTVYNGDFWCANESAQLHEIGHNWGLK